MFKIKERWVCLGSIAILMLCLAGKGLFAQDQNYRIVFMDNFPNGYIPELPAESRDVSSPELEGQLLLSSFKFDSILMDERILRSNDPLRSYREVTTGMRLLIESARLNEGVADIEVPNNIDELVRTNFYLADDGGIVAQVTLIGDLLGIVRHYSSTRELFCLDYITFTSLGLD